MSAAQTAVLPPRTSSSPTRVSRAEAMARAVQHYRAGRLGDAAQIYGAIVAGDPCDADALHLLGVVADAQGDPARAAELIGQALQIRETPSYHSNFGMVLGHLGRHVAALASYERALALRPDYPEALNNLGTSLEALHRFDEAEAAYRKAIAARPNYADVWSNLGNTLRSLGRADEAVAAFEQSLAHNPLAGRAPLGHALRAVGRSSEAAAVFRQDIVQRPDSAEALNNLAAALGDDERHGEAAALLAQATAQRPDYPEAHVNLGQALQQLGRLDEAAAACERALELRPDYPDALGNLGNVLRLLGRLPEAETKLRRALALRPADVNSYNNLAITLQAQDRPDEALAVLDLAAALKPDDAETHHHRAMLLLRQGRFGEGWAEYEWRFRTRQAGNAQAQFPNKPRWNGENLDGRRIVLVPEQGLGDAIQFARYAPHVAERCGSVTLAVQKPLLRLMRSLPESVQVVGIDERIAPFDVYCPLLSLPRAFATTLDTIPAATPYLQPQPDAVARWAVRLRRDAPGLRIGVVWAGNPQHVNDRERSLPLAALAPLWALQGIRWFSLQVGKPAADLRELQSAERPDIVEDLSPELTDFADTAAAMAGLDLVISCDTSAAHLAGAVGVPVWLLLPAVADWRWLRTGDASPWYPTMRLFRQDARRDWASVVVNVCNALRERRLVR